MRQRLGRLTRDFHLLWAGETIGNVGDRVTLFVVPTLMVFALGASAFDIGLVSMAQYVAIPVLSLVAGALVDRWDVRHLLIACDLVRAAAVVLIPIAYWQGFLGVPLLFLCVATVSAATVFFNIGYIPALSSIVDAPDLVRANSRLEGSRTVSELGGPALAGWLYQLVGAGALLVDAFSYLFSAAAFRAMRPFAVTPVRSTQIRARLALGIRLNWTDPILRRSTAGTLLANIGGPIFVTQMPVLAYQGLHLSAATFGTVMSIAALGAVLGAVLAPIVSRRLGSGRMLGCPWCATRPRASVSSPCPRSRGHRPMWNARAVRLLLHLVQHQQPVGAPDPGPDRRPGRDPRRVPDGDLGRDPDQRLCRRLGRHAAQRFAGRPRRREVHHARRDGDRDLVDPAAGPDAALAGHRPTDALAGGAGRGAGRTDTDADSVVAATT
jgi:MFS family permease